MHFQHASGSSRLAGFRVVRIYFRLPPAPGGMEAHIAQLSTAQRRLGVEVLNVYHVGHNVGPAVQLIKNFDLMRIRPAALRNAVFYARALLSRGCLRSVQPTVLHVHGDWSDFLYSRLLARILGAEVVVATLHDAVAKRKSWLYRLALMHCNLVFCTGKNDQLWLQCLLKRTIHHLPSAPLDIFFQSQATNRSVEYDVITVSNFHQKKRLDLIVDCALRRPDLRFLVIGDGPQRQSVMARARAAQLSNIEFAGQKSPEEIIKALRRARLFMLTSQEEGTPTAALEAMAVGLPVVLTPSNDYSWLVEQGINGYVTCSWLVDELVSRVDDVLRNEARRLAMGANSRERAGKHSWRANAEHVTALMAQHLGSTGE